jgi:hypothetical protein
MPLSWLRRRRGTSAFDWRKCGPSTHAEGSPECRLRAWILLRPPPTISRCSAHGTRCRAPQRFRRHRVYPALWRRGLAPRSRTRTRTRRYQLRPRSMNGSISRKRGRSESQREDARADHEQDERDRQADDRHGEEQRRRVVPMARIAPTVTIQTRRTSGIASMRTRSTPIRGSTGPANGAILRLPMERGESVR